MTEKEFKFKSFEISKTERFLNEVKLYEIDINHSDDLDESNLFYVYSDSEGNIIQIVEKLNELQEERDYFERKKCEYQKKISILTTDKITLKSVLEDTENLMELVKEQNKLIDLKMKPETVQLLTRLENKIDYYKKVHER